MKTTRRDFMKLSAGAFSITMLAPRLALGGAADGPAADRRILVVVQLAGGNDGFNTVIPYSDARYHSLRPTIGLREDDLRDEAGNSTIINDQYAFHPALKELKELYVTGRLAVVLGVGYPNPNLSHGISTDIWQTANTGQGSGLGWLGRYADSALVGVSPLPAAALGLNYPPKVISSQRVNIPMIARLGESAFRTTAAADRDVIVRTFRELNGRSFPAGSFAARVAEIGAAAERNSGLLEQAIATYHSSVTYNSASVLAQALKSVAVLATVFPASVLFHVSYFGSFDTHAHQIGTVQDQFQNKVSGVHAVELRYLSEAMKAFYDDMVEQGLADRTVLMTYSEFGRRPNENASNGTDHGTASSLFVLGGAVKGGDLYGLPPSLAATDLDADGNVRFTTDFRSVYATLLDRWLPGGDSRRVLGDNFAPLGFL